MSRKQPKRRAGNMVFTIIAGIFIAAIVGGVGLSASSAMANAQAAGAENAVRRAESSAASVAAASAESVECYEKSTLASTSPRTIDSGMKMLDERDRKAKEKLKRENLAIFKRVASQKAMQGVDSPDEPPASKDDDAQEREDARGGSEDSANAANVVPDEKTTADESTSTGENPSSASAASSAAAPATGDDGAGSSNASEPDDNDPVELTIDGQTEYGLPAVDWSVGKEAFVREWGARIDAYLAGSQLDGYGPVFAEAAWENGVDPRWSPAISNTESGKGAVCFLPCNAWGWGASSWPDWETAIREHVAGLAAGYGYSLTLEAAGAYCPPNQQHWYETTLNEMSLI